MIGISSPCLTIIEWCEKQGMSLDELAILSHHNLAVEVRLLPVMDTIFKCEQYTVFLFMHEDIYMHDFRSTQQYVASSSTCVDSIAWAWSDGQIQFDFMNNICALQHACCRYVLISYSVGVTIGPIVIQYWCCSTTGAVTEATCVAQSEQTDHGNSKRYVYNGTQ